MILLNRAILLSISICGALLNGAPSALAKTKTVPPLIYQNNWSTPEQVLNEFLKYDEQGKVWAGMGDLERQVFNTWNESPPIETFYRFTERRMGKTEAGSDHEVKIPVTWKVSRHQDGFGTQHPMPAKNTLRVVFVLKKQNGAWRIHAPNPSSYTPFIRGP